MLWQPRSIQILGGPNPRSILRRPDPSCSPERQTNLGPMIALAVAGVSLLAGWAAWNATRPTDSPNAENHAITVSAKQGQPPTNRPEESARGQLRFSLNEDMTSPS